MTHPLERLKRIADETIRKQAIDNFDESGYMPKDDDGTLAYAISEGFVWLETPEGHEYWDNIYELALNIQLELLREPIEDEQPINIHREIADQYQGLFNIMSKEYGLILTISEMDEIVIESLKLTEHEKVKLENEKLRECLKGFIDHSGYNKYTRKHYLHNHEFSEIITQAKQLLNQLEK